MTNNIHCPPQINKSGSFCLIIHGQVLVVALWRPKGITTFGELLNIFVVLLLNTGTSYDISDIVFDHCQNVCIRAGIRIKCDHHSCPNCWIRKDLFYFIPNGLSLLQYQPTRHPSVKPCNCKFPEFKTLGVAGGFKKKR